MAGGAIVKEDLTELFSGIIDPRIERNKLYPIGEIFFLVIVGVLSGVESWRGLELLGNERLAFLEKYLPYKNGICSHQTISRVFSLIKPKYFEQVFMEIMSKLFPKQDLDIIALDGKTLKGSANKERGQKALHLLNAWSVKNGVSLAQIEVESKTNEITQIPEIIKMLNVEGAIITSDALNCQKNITKEIRDAKADYVLAVKGNQPALYAALIEKYEESLPKETQNNFFQKTEKGHGRVETRSYYSLKAGTWIPNIDEWTDINSVGIAICDVHKSGKNTGETRFFISSLPPNAEKLAEAVRGHWGIENQLHWVLDVTFKEDASKKRTDHAPRNFSLIRKFALNLLKKDSTKGHTGPMKRIKAAINLDYLAGIIQPLTGI